MRAVTIAAAIIGMTATSVAANDGQEANKAFRFCLERAAEQCGANTIRCRGYRKGFVKACMTEIGIDPGYIMLLTEDLDG